MNNVIRISELIGARIILIISNMLLKFEPKCIMTNDYQKELLFEKEIEIINEKIEKLSVKYHQLLFYSLTSTKSEIDANMDNYIKVNDIIENNIYFSLDWIIKNRIDPSEYENFDYDSIESFDIVTSSKNVSTVINITDIDEIIDLIIWINYYFHIYFKYYELKKTIKNEVESLQSPNQNLTGFDCQLQPETLEVIHSQMLNNNYIETDINNFKAIFSNKQMISFTPIKWLILNPKGKVNKTALFVFIKCMLGKATNDIMKKKVKEFFRDRKGYEIEIKTYPSTDEQDSINYFTNIAGLPKLPDQN